MGHITLDRVVTPTADLLMPGGTAWYFSKAISKLDTKYILVTAMGQQEQHFAHQLTQDGIELRLFESAATVYFENIYGANLNERSQRVLQTADPFTPEQVKDIDAKIFHLGTLLSNDIPLAVIKALHQKGMVSADVQGYLRTLSKDSVLPTDWNDKIQALPYIDILKVNEYEMQTLTGTNDIQIGIQQLHMWGAKEVVVTLGNLGSVISDGSSQYNIPAYLPSATVDATGCGDTYMTGYLYKRAEGATIEEAGKFGAAIATLKIEKQGPFSGTESEITDVMKNYSTAS